MISSVKLIGLGYILWGSIFVPHLKRGKYVKTANMLCYVWAHGCFTRLCAMTLCFPLNLTVQANATENMFILHRGVLNVCLCRSGNFGSLYWVISTHQIWINFWVKTIWQWIGVVRICKICLRVVCSLILMVKSCGVNFNILVCCPGGAL